MIAATPAASSVLEYLRKRHVIRRRIAGTSALVKRVLGPALAIGLCVLQACSPASQQMAGGTPNAAAVAPAADTASMARPGQAYVAAASSSWNRPPVITKAVAQPADPQEAARMLTNLLHEQRLPLVGAQVLASDHGAREVILYGFTTTAKEKAYAASTARAVLNDPRVVVVNRILVRPELPPSDTGTSAVAGASSAIPSSDPHEEPTHDTFSEPSLPGPNEYQAYRNQGGRSGTWVPLLELLATIALGFL